MKRFDLVSIIANDYRLLKRKFCGNLNKLVIKNSSESIEDIYHNQLIVLLKAFPNHSSDEYKTEFDFILKELKKKPQKENKQVQTVEYYDNYENQPDESDPYIEFEGKLNLLLIHYSPKGKNKKARKTKV